MPAKERGIIFSGPMVRAILEGRKTQTRRVIRPQPEGKFFGWLLESTDSTRKRGDARFEIGALANYARCPYGVPGDRLYVRETFSPYLNREGCWYWADGNEALYDATRPKPSIHMPKWAARIWLEITDIRVERVQGISEEDALAEGAMEWWNAMDQSQQAKLYNGGRGPRAAFQMLWNSLNEKRGYGWNVNPWLWIVKFKRIKK